MFRFPRQRWQIAPAQADLSDHLAQATQMSPLLTQVLINRGIDSLAAAETFLKPEQQILPSPLEEFPDLPIALELMLDAIANRRAIAICGDYDADGMTSTALLLRALRALGAIVDYAIPSRMQEGYGINQRIVEEFYDEGVQIILTVDNGIAAVEPIARARALGLTVIVTDHHDLPEVLPPANAILNPKLIREESPYRGVAGVGVAYILAVCLAQCLSKTQDLTTPLIELFTLGTIADLAPLTGVNRRWVKRGLRLLPKSRIPGIQALIQVAGLSNEKALKPEAIGFRLGPRINAIGRISDPQIIIELLTTDDDGQALELAMKCEQVNQYRQRLCELIEQEAIAWCEQTQFDGQKERVLLIVQPEWHHGVIGIVASRLVERYGVPVFIGTYENGTHEQAGSAAGSIIRGSARGIPEFNVFDALQACRDLLERFGGHRAAGGFTFKAENLDAVRSRLSSFAHQHLQPQHLKPLVSIDVQADLSHLTFDLFSQIDQLHPCGMENPDPVFWTPNVCLSEQQAIGRGQAHLKLTVNSDRFGTPACLKALAWRWGEYYPLPSRMDIAYRLRLNEWNGVRTVELELVGVRPSETAPATPTLQEQFARYELASKPTPEPTELTLENALVVPTGAPTNAFTSAAVEPDGLPPFSPDTETAAQIEFYHNRRLYSCSVQPSGHSKELRIRNSEAQVLAIQPQQRQGYLGKRHETAQLVDVSQPHYFNLIRAALWALEVAEKSRLLQAKEQLLAEKDRQIADLIQQLALHQEQGNLPLISSAQPPADLRSPTAQGDVKQQLKAHLGHAWSCLGQSSQRDLTAAYKSLHAIQAEAFTAAVVDYSEAGLKLGLAAEREIVQPFFKQLYQFMQSQGSTVIGGMALKSRKKYRLEMLPPFLAPQWNSFLDQALLSSEALTADSCYLVTCEQLSLRDRHLVQDCLQQWPHPLSQWLLNQTEAAAAIAQISQLHNIATQADQFLYEWQFELLRSLIIGTPPQPGILQAIYNAGKN